MPRISQFAYFPAVAGLTLALLLTGCAAQPVAEPTPTQSVSHDATATPAHSVTPTPPSEPVVAPPAEPVLAVTTNGTVAAVNAQGESTWEPPTWTGVYQVVDEAHGFPATGGTAFYITHARSPWSAERGEGNDWVDVLTTPGDIVLLDGTRFVIDAVISAAKTDIGAVPIWEHIEGRAVLITCVPRWEGSAVENRIIILEAERTP